MSQPLRTPCPSSPAARLPPRRAARRRLACAALAAGLGWLCPGLHAQPAALTVGVPPFLSAGAVLETVRPMREHLERRLGRPVEVYSARDFRAMYEAARRGDDDLVVLPAHAAAVAIADWQYRPLVSLFDDTTLLVMVRKDGPLRSVADLRGQRIGMLDPVSLSAVSAMQWLRGQQLLPGQDVHPVTLSSISSGLVALERDEIDALMITSVQMSMLRGTPANVMRQLAVGPPLPAPLLLAHGRLPEDQVRLLSQALLDFQPDPQRPGGVFNAPLRAVTPEMLGRVRALLEPTRALLR